MSGKWRIISQAIAYLLAGMAVGGVLGGFIIAGLRALGFIHW